MQDRDLLFKEAYFSTQDGLSIYYRDYPGNPAATPVLCLHGLTRNSRDFEDLAAVMAPERRVVVPDMRGRGHSDYDSNYLNYQIPTYANDVLALLTLTQIERAIIIGTSMGGLIAMALAVMRPAALAGVILNDIGPEVDPKGLARIAAYTGAMPPVQSWQDAADQICNINRQAFPDYGPDDWLRFARRTFKDGAKGKPEPDYDPRIGNAVRDSSKTAVPTDLWTLYDALRDIPLLTLRGEISDILTPATAEKMAWLHPGMTLVSVAGRGHAPALDEPSSLTAIQTFLEAHGRS